MISSSDGDVRQALSEWNLSAIGGREAADSKLPTLWTIIYFKGLNSPFRDAMELFGSCHDKVKFCG